MVINTPLETWIWDWVSHEQRYFTFLNLLCVCSDRSWKVLEPQTLHSRDSGFV